MKELIVRGYSLAETYHKALEELSTYGELVNSADWGCDCLEASLTMSITQPLSEPMISRCCICSPEALEQYRQELLDGILDFNIGTTWDYTYHNRMVFPVDQKKFILNELKRNPGSRRAVIDVRNISKDCYSEDPACLQHIQYFIRNNKLDCCVLFRSNDATRANFMNSFGLIMLQKWFADELGIEVGTFTLRANSFHCYGNELDNLNNYVKKIKEKGYTDKSIVFNYKGNWDKKMEDSKSIIEEKVRKLRGEE